MRAWWGIPGLVVAACYSPKVPDNVVCTPGETPCPDGQSCLLVGGSYACTSGPGDMPADAELLPDVAIDGPNVRPPDASIDAPPTPIAFVQQNTAKPTATTTTIALPDQVGAHDAIIVCLNYPLAANATLTSITDTLNNTYTVVLGPHPGNSDQHYIAVAFDTAPGTDTLTLTLSAATNGGSDLLVVEYSGLALSGAFDVKSAMSGNGTAMTSGTAQTTAAHELLVGYAEAPSATAGTGFTMRANQSGNIEEDQVVFATGAYEATATTTTGVWTMMLATFKGQ